jgi:mersacidin/lichenicidin family type 2 lantibiotic
VTPDYTVQAWKDPDLREALDVPAHPSGEIELMGDDPAGGGADTMSTPWTPVSIATLAVCTPALSCWPEPTCEYSVGHGTCGWFSYGCC